MIDREELITLVPHKGKMFLLSRITDYDLEKRFLSAEADITRDCIFYDDTAEGVPSWAGFEFMAQSISALSGLRGRAASRPPRMGVILSISNMEIFHPFIRSKALIHVAETAQLGDVHTFHGELSAADGKAVSASLTVMDVDVLEPLIVQSENGGNSCQ